MASLTTLTVDTATKCLEANPDIDGMGVRLSFYIQTLLLVLTAGRSLEEASNSVLALIGMSFGLVISAFVSAAQNQLPLHQAIVVTYLIWLANWAMFLALAAYYRHPAMSHPIQYFAVLQTYVSTACMLYLWVRAPTLEDAESAGTVFVFLFMSLSAIGVGRTVALAFIAVLLVAYSITVFAPLWHHPLPPPTQSRRRWHQPAFPIDPHLITLFAIFVVPYAISVACTELQIRRNPLCPDTGDFWGFGQVVVLTMTIVPIFVAAKVYWKYRLKSHRQEDGKCRTCRGTDAAHGSGNPRTSCNAI